MSGGGKQPGPQDAAALDSPLAGSVVLFPGGAVTRLDPAAFAAAAAKAQNADGSASPDAAGQDQSPAAAAKATGKAKRGKRGGDAGGDSAADAGGGDGLRDDRPQAIKRFNEQWAFVLMGSKAVVFRELGDAPVEDRSRVLGLEAFRAYLLNRSVRYQVIGEDGAPQWRSVKLAALWLASPDRRQYDGVEFFPDAGGEPGLPGYYNLWRGFSVTADAAGLPALRWRKYAVFLDHCRVNVCGGDAALFTWLWHWFAHLLQRPRERIGTAIVLRGKMGSGKTIVGEIIGSLIAAHYFLVDDPRYLTGQFNAHLMRCLLLQVDEGFWAGDKQAEGRLKGLVTSSQQMIELKGVDPGRAANFVRVMFSSNEEWVVPAGMEERRFCVIDVGDAVAQRHDYFAEMREEIDNGGREALLADLLAVDLDAADAPNLRRIPMTSALLDQKLLSLDAIASWWHERLQDGAPTRRGAEWRSSVPCHTLHDDYVKACDAQGHKYKASPTAFGMRLSQLLPRDAARGWAGLDKAKRSESVLGDDGAWSSRRVNAYVLPLLGVCRACFEAAVGQTMNWVAEAGAAGEPDG